MIIKTHFKISYRKIMMMLNNNDFKHGSYT